MTLPHRIAVTGGAGFIGSHVVEALVEAGSDVLVIDDLSHACGAQPPESVRLCATDEGSPEAAQALARFRPQALLHLAARGGVKAALADPGRHAGAVLGSTIGAYAAAVAAGAGTIVSASSGGALYGDASRLPADEELPALPRSPYGASKAAEEAYLTAFRSYAGIRAVALRFGNVYGPRQDGDGEAGVVAITCRRLSAGRRPILYGDGGQTRDFVFVKDVAATCLAALATESAEGAINVGTGRETPVAEVVQTLVELDGGGVTIQWAPAREGEVRRSCLAVGRAASLLGWQARTTLRDGLRETLESFLEERNALQERAG
jgi:UDP-glucose 4-epimerase